MKKIFTILLIAGLMLLTPVKADETTNPDWIWLNGWVYVGDGDPTDPPPPPFIR